MTRKKARVINTRQIGAEIMNSTAHEINNSLLDRYSLIELAEECMVTDCLLAYCFKRFHSGVLDLSDDDFDSLCRDFLPFIVTIKMAMEG